MKEIITNMPRFYRYKEYNFEFHPYMGPMLLNKDLEPSKRTLGSNSKFWSVFEEWKALPKEQQEEFRI